MTRVIMTFIKIVIVNPNSKSYDNDNGTDIMKMHNTHIIPTIFSKQNPKTKTKINI